MVQGSVCGACRGAVLSACWLAIACGSRTAIDICATGGCLDESNAGTSGAGAGGDAGKGGGAGVGGDTGVGGAGAAGVAGAVAVAGAGAGGFAGVGGLAGAGGVGGAGAGGVAGEAGVAGMGVAGAAGAPSDPPIVLLLVDGSFSMFQSNVWMPTFDALTGPDGPIERYQERIRFGFASYRGPGQMSEDDPACAEMTSTPFALDNSKTIRETYGALATRQGYYETPTGHALTRVTQDLLAESPEARKYVLLFSDGAPDTCLTTRPQCGQDRAVFAVQQAFRAGIQTHAIGIGYGTEYDCFDDEARCGSNHFQDLANAGRGLPVQAPPDVYARLPCAAETGGVLLAEYAEQAGTAAFTWAFTPEEVRGAVESILGEVVEP